MAKKSLITIDGTYCKIKKGLLTADGVYNKVKKAFITIGGVYRPCMSSEELVYYGEVTPLSEGRSHLSGGSIGDYALFVGGRRHYYDDDGYIVGDEWSGYSKADAYDSSLTMRTINYTNQAGYQDASFAQIGDYALFGGGYNAYDSGENSFYRNIGTINKSLTSSYVRNGLTNVGTLVAATTIGDYALFCGGWYIDDYGDELSHSYTSAINASLSRVSSPQLSDARSSAGAVTIGEHALIAGGDGRWGGYLNTVETYNQSLTKGSAENLTREGEYLHTCGRAGNRAIFIGEGSTVVDTYDESLTKTSFTIADNEGQFGPYAAVSLGEYVVFYNEYGGYSSNYSSNNTIEVYDSSCTKTVLKKIGRKGSDENSLIYWPAASAIGDYVLFAGGEYDDYWEGYRRYSPDVHAVKFIRE